MIGFGMGWKYCAIRRRGKWQSFIYKGAGKAANILWTSMIMDSQESAKEDAEDAITRHFGKEAINNFEYAKANS